jgi:sugar-phosphatase
MPPCRGILFDLDGVLVDSMGMIVSRLREWAKGHRLDPAQVLAVAHGRTQLELVLAVAPGLDAETEARVLAKREIEDIHRLHACRGARELLASLPQSAWAIVTSGQPAVVQARLRAARLPTPRVLITAADVRVGKPDPEGYVLAARSLGFPPGDCVVLEDAPAGIQAGRAAGCRVGAVTGRGEQLEPADFSVGDLLGLALCVTPGSPERGTLGSPRLDGGLSPRSGEAAVPARS